MITHFSVYRLADGVFTGGQVGLPAAASEANRRHVLDSATPEGHATIEGRFDRFSQRIDISTGQVVDYQPPAPDADYEWNGKRWQPSAAAIAREAARRADLQRIAELEGSQHAVMRALLLGDESAKPKLQAIHDELAALSAGLA